MGLLSARCLMRLLHPFSQGCSSGRAQLELVHGVLLSQVLDLAFAIAEFHNIAVGPP